MWVFNVFLYLAFLFNPLEYKELISNGASCYVWVGGGTPDGPAPACIYLKERTTDKFHDSPTLGKELEQ